MCLSVLVQYHACLSARMLRMSSYLFIYLERTNAADAGGRTGQYGDRPGAHQKRRQRQLGRRGEETVRPLCVPDSFLELRRSGHFCFYLVINESAAANALAPKEDRPSSIAFSPTHA